MMGIREDIEEMIRVSSQACPPSAMVMTVGQLRALATVSPTLRPEIERLLAEAGETEGIAVIGTGPEAQALADEARRATDWPVFTEKWKGEGHG
jgi:hypothetical protein